MLFSVCDFSCRPYIGVTMVDVTGTATPLNICISDDSQFRSQFYSVSLLHFHTPVGDHLHLSASCENPVSCKVLIVLHFLFAIMAVGEIVRTESKIWAC